MITPKSSLKNLGFPRGKNGQCMTGLACMSIQGSHMANHIGLQNPCVGETTSVLGAPLGPENCDYYQVLALEAHKNPLYYLSSFLPLKTVPKHPLFLLLPPYPMPLALPEDSSSLPQSEDWDFSRLVCARWHSGAHTSGISAKWLCLSAPFSQPPFHVIDPTDLSAASEVRWRPAKHVTNYALGHRAGQGPRFSTASLLECILTRAPLRS